MAPFSTLTRLWLDSTVTRLWVDSTLTWLWVPPYSSTNVIPIHPAALRPTLCSPLCLAPAVRASTLPNMESGYVTSSLYGRVTSSTFPVPSHFVLSFPRAYRTAPRSPVRLVLPLHLLVPSLTDHRHVHGPAGSQVRTAAAALIQHHFLLYHHHLRCLLHTMHWGTRNDTTGHWWR